MTRHLLSRLAVHPAHPTAALLADPATRRQLDSASGEVAGAALQHFMAGSEGNELLAAEARGELPQLSSAAPATLLHDQSAAHSEGWAPPSPRVSNGRSCDLPHPPSHLVAVCCPHLSHHWRCSNTSWRRWWPRRAAGSCTTAWPQRRRTTRWALPQTQGLPFSWPGSHSAHTCRPPSSTPALQAPPKRPCKQRRQPRAACWLR